MNRNDFLNMIEEKIQVNRRMLGDIYELIDIFPYFQSAHLLILKGLQNNSDVKFESQLRNSAIHIADREVLYYLLMTNHSPGVESAVINEDKTPAEIFGSDTQQTVIESAKNSEYLINEIEKNSGETNPLEHDDPYHNMPVHSILISTESENEDSTGVMLLMDEESSDSEDQVFYMDPGFSVPENSELLELDMEENRLFSSEKDASEDQKLNPGSEDSDKQLQSELIDKFIITNPRIEPVKEKTNIQSEDILIPRIEEEVGLVTETLAKIYINQAYYSKAIDIYEKLSLKFPEKSSYFASQIEKVKEYLKK
jgi:hypothetical protein